jgi:hypothetical protein
MFVIHASYCSLLSAVCRGLSDVSVGYLTEVMNGSSVIYGVEVEISGQFHIASNTIRMFSDCSVVGCLKKFGVQLRKQWSLVNAYTDSLSSTTATMRC